MSAKEVSEIVGVPVTFDESALKPLNEYGTSSAYYIYDTESSTLHALVQLIQDSAYKEPPSSGFNAASRFQQDIDFMKDNAVPVENLGDKAFYNANINQVGVLYKDCYILVAFDGVKEEQDEEACRAVARKILENMD